MWGLMWGLLWRLGGLRDLYSQPSPAPKFVCMINKPVPLREASNLFSYIQYLMHIPSALAFLKRPIRKKDVVKQDSPFLDLPLDLI